MNITVLVTGAAGFLGRHIMEALGRIPDVVAIGYDVHSRHSDLEHALASAEVIYHLAGVNRPEHVGEFEVGNAGFTAELCARLELLKRTPIVVLASSIQAALDNPYGISKRHAEETLQGFCRRTGAHVLIYRLKNLFGKWCRPNYNSVVATFCHSISHDLPITVSDPTRELELAYIDDVVAAFLKAITTTLGREPADRCVFCEVERSFKTTLGQLAEKIRSFRDSRRNLTIPSFADEFTRCLYATYLSYLDGSDFGYNLNIKTDNRGSLAEFMKSRYLGQIFVSRTKPGISRGNHYHHTKTEKFMVVEGDAVIRFRQVAGKEIIEYPVSGTEFKVVDIPPGYTHSIENVGTSEMVVLFWASAIFDPQHPDTYPMPVV